ncbi:hypothetical protein CspeluHIS016_0210000 [Cutaneotrichosporon spelunceum]|uniref:EXS domain-containing protein n=1 Tax=Cutaneotrichosporon spelunceum TaxID=1672016 RepID=A0AAD3YBM6_9TREE|nr:hypothetical protein CspeluHIS016_0210000 [Cutaneotrichosporon spelunceum]
MDTDTSLGDLPIPLPEFSASFPLPFRVLFLIGLAILLWAVNLNVLSLLGIDVSWALDIRDGDDTAFHDDVPRPTPLVPSKYLYGPVYKLFLGYTTWCVSGYTLFRWICGDNTDAMERWRGLVGAICLVPFIYTLAPIRGFGYRERRALRHALVRCLNPPARESIFFCDVILADILTSFAKVLGDLFVSANQLIFGGISHGRQVPHGATKWLVLGMVCLPYIIRFRQCMVEFYHSGWKSMRPFANACKYASAFPVIFLSAMQKTVVTEVAAAKGVTTAELSASGRWFGEHRLFRLWLLAVVINSMFSFYWDVQKDWGLSLLELETWMPVRRENAPTHARSLSQPQSLWGRLTAGKSHQLSPLPTPGGYDSRSNSRSNSPTRRTAHWGLRPTLLLPDPAVYYLFTVLDLVLRFTWSLELSSHLHVISDIESGVFLMEALELVRRWMWVFVRVEWEAVRMGEMTRLHAPGHVERTAVLWDDKDAQRED